MQTSWLTCFGKDSGLVLQVEVHRDGLTPCNALDLVRQYDIVVDASDNAPTRYYRFLSATTCTGALACPTSHVCKGTHARGCRYLASDACVIAGRPLVSGAALGTDGQLTVYNYGPDGGSGTPIEQPRGRSSQIVPRVPTQCDGTVANDAASAGTLIRQDLRTRVACVCVHLERSPVLQGRATGACTRSRLAPTPAAAAPTPGCWAPCPASSAACRSAACDASVPPCEAHHDACTRLCSRC